MAAVHERFFATTDPATTRTFPYNEPSPITSKKCRAFATTAALRQVCASAGLLLGPAPSPGGNSPSLPCSDPPRRPRAASTITRSRRVAGGETSILSLKRPLHCVGPHNLPFACALICLPCNVRCKCHRLPTHAPITRGLNTPMSPAHPAILSHRNSAHTGACTEETLQGSKQETEKYT